MNNTKKDTGVQIRVLAERFRTAIEETVNNQEIPFSNRMHWFPIGCCDDACDLLGFYLKEYGINTVQVIGTYRDEVPEHTCGHAWLKTEGGEIVDITGDQFKDCEELMNYNIPVYVGPMDAVHFLFADQREYSNYAFFASETESNKRLIDTYNLILRHLPESV